MGRESTSSESTPSALCHDSDWPFDLSTKNGLGGSVRFQTGSDPLPENYCTCNSLRGVRKYHSSVVRRFWEVSDLRHRSNRRTTVEGPDTYISQQLEHRQKTIHLKQRNLLVSIVTHQCMALPRPYETGRSFHDTEHLAPRTASASPQSSLLARSTTRRHLFPLSRRHKP